MQKNLWNLDIDDYVAGLEDVPTFSVDYQSYLKSVYKNVVSDMQNKMELDCENFELVFEFIFAEQWLNLILFCFSYDYDISQTGLLNTFKKEGKTMYLGSLEFDNYEFESANSFANA